MSIRTIMSGQEVKMSDELVALLDAARSMEMSSQQREAQRRSFVYGNTKLENDYVTPALVDEVADCLGDARSK
jgi:hypothetical protein